MGKLTKSKDKEIKAKTHDYQVGQEFMSDRGDIKYIKSASILSVIEIVSMLAPMMT